MATTTNYGWTTPDDTALVKDGASAIRTLGSSVDTTTKNLNPETTLGDVSFRSSSSNVNTRLGIGSSGQVLTVAAGVPSWATPTDQTPLTTKGDIFTFSTLDARLGVGANATVLTADSTEATGLKWVAPASPAFKGVRCTVASLSIANGVDQVILSTTETFDEGLYHSNVSNTGRLTVPAGEAGYYNIYFVMQWQNGATGQRSIQPQVNGVTNLNPTVIIPDASQYLTCTGSTTYYLGVGDYVQLIAFQNRGSALNIDGGSFGMNKVG